MIDDYRVVESLFELQSLWDVSGACRTVWRRVSAKFRYDIPYPVLVYLWEAGRRSLRRNLFVGKVGAKTEEKLVTNVSFWVGPQKFCNWFVFNITIEWLLSSFFLIGHILLIVNLRAKYFELLFAATTEPHATKDLACLLPNNFPGCLVVWPSLGHSSGDIFGHWWGLLWAEI